MSEIEWKTIEEIKGLTMKPSEESLQLAAQCWCDEETGHIVMDTDLAFAFAKRLDVKDAEILRLKTIVDFYEAPPQTQFAVQMYAELSALDKEKINNLMQALKECAK